MSGALLEARGVRTGYGRLPVVFNVDLEIKEGEIVALLGPNGAGKTTTLRALSGMLPLMAGDVRLDTRSGKVTLAGEPVKLTAQEYKLLSYLLHHKGKVVSRTELIEHIYDQDFDRDSNTIEVFVTRIRKKLGADVITTIRGLGYSLEEPDDITA